MASAPASGESAERVWRRGAIVESWARYKRLVTLLASQPRYAVKLAQAVELADADEFAAVLVNVLHASGGTLGIIRTLLLSEFSAENVQAVGGAGRTVLRGNGILTKIESAFVRRVGRDYLRTLIGDLVAQVVHDPELNLEVDPRRVADAAADDEDEPGAQLAAQVAALKATAQLFVERITAPEMVALMPREVRAIAAYTAEQAALHCPDACGTLVGAFVMLRYICPAIAAPESVGLVPLEAPPSMQARRNLVLLAKLLQTLANGAVQGAGREAYMAPLADWVAHNLPAMAAYLAAVPAMPPAPTPAAPTPAPAAPVDVNMGALAVADLFALHRIVWRYTPALFTALGRDAGGGEGADTAFVAFIAELGPPPTLRSRAAPDPADKPVAAPAAKSSATPRSNALLDTSALEAARFLYVQGHTRDGLPVVYFIVNRLRPEFLVNINLLVTHVFKVMEAIVSANAKYALVIDMSWATFSDDHKSNGYRYIRQLSNAFSRSVRKNLAAAYIVHPTSYTRAVIFFMRAWTSKKLSRKLHELYTWKDLGRFIDPARIALPDTSRDFITKAYKVQKVNAKGRSQARLIKFTPTSLLNIDPKTRRLQNEKALADIEEMSAPLNVPELRMRFKEETAAAAKLSWGADPEDLVSRRYVCASLAERDAIVEDVFRFAFKAGAAAGAGGGGGGSSGGGGVAAGGVGAGEFQVTKINQAGKRQARTVKLTCDSLLNLNERDIRSETAFAGIDEAVIDPSSPNTVLVKFKSEDFRRPLLCRDGEAPLLTRALADAVRHYQALHDSELARDAANMPALDEL